MLVVEYMPRDLDAMTCPLVSAKSRCAVKRIVLVVAGPLVFGCGGNSQSGDSSEVDSGACSAQCIGSYWRTSTVMSEDPSCTALYPDGLVMFPAPTPPGCDETITITSESPCSWTLLRVCPDGQSEWSSRVLAPGCDKWEQTFTYPGTPLCTLTMTFERR